MRSEDEVNIAAKALLDLYDRINPTSPEGLEIAGRLDVIAWVLGIDCRIIPKLRLDLMRDLQDAIQPGGGKG